MPGHRMTPSFFRHRGFSLVELMVVLAILAIVAAVAVPSYQSSTESSRESAALNQLLGTLQFARSEAAAGADTAVTSVSVCASSDQASCGSDWSTGGIVRASNGRVLRTIPVFKDVTISGNAVAFKRSGELSGASSATITVQVGSRAAKTISVNAIGFAKID